MPENVIEIRLVAKDEGVTQALSQVQQGLAKTERATQAGLAKTEEATKKGTQAQRAYGESYGGSIRGTRLLATGLAFELDPALATVLARMNQATAGLRIMGLGFGPVTLGIAAAITGLVLYIRRMDELTERQAKFNLAIKATDTGPALTQLRQLSEATERTRINLTSGGISGGLIEAVKALGVALVRLDFGKIFQAFATIPPPSAFEGFAGEMDLVETKAKSLRESLQGVLKDFVSTLQEGRLTELREALGAFEKARTPEAIRNSTAAVAQFGAALANIRVQEVQLGEPVWLALRKTRADEVRDRVEKLIPALEKVRQTEIAAATAALKAQTEQKLAPLRAAFSGLPEGEQAAAIQRERSRILKESGPALAGQIEQINAKIDAQIKQANDELFTAQNAAFKRLADQAREAGFKIVGTLAQAIQDASDQQKKEQQIDVLLGLGRDAPEAAVRRIADIQRRVLDQLKKFRQEGANVELSAGDLGALTGSLSFLKGSLLEQRLQEKETLEDAFRTRLREAFKEHGGISAQAAEEALIAVEKRANELGVLITPRLQEGLRKGIATGRTREGEDIITQGIKGQNVLAGMLQGLTKQFERDIKDLEITLPEGIERSGGGIRAAVLEAIRKIITPKRQELLGPALGFTDQLREEIESALKKFQLSLSSEEISALVAQRLRQQKIQARIDLTIGLSAQDIAARREEIQQAAERLGQEVPPAFVEGALLAERNIASAELWDRVLDAPRFAMIRLADFAAKHGVTAGEQFEGGFRGGLMRLVEDAGTFGQNINSVIVGIGSSMTRGMDDTFFNIMTGQFKKLPDLAKQVGLSIVRELTGALARFSAKSLTDLLGQLFPQTGRALAVLLGVSGGAGGVQAIFPGLASAQGNLVPALSTGAGAGTAAAGGGSAAGLAGLIGGAGSLIAGGVGLFGAAAGSFGSNPFISGISGALSGLSAGVGLAALFGLAAGPFAVVGAVLGFALGVVGGIKSSVRERRVADKNKAFDSWLRRIDAAKDFDELDFILGPGTAPEHVAIFQGWAIGEPGPPASTRTKGFDPSRDLRWNTAVYLNLNAVPDFIERGSAAIRQKIAQFAQEEGLPAGLVIEDVTGGIRRTAIFSGGVGGLEARLAEARSRAGFAELFLDAFGDDALAEKALKRMQEAAARIDLKITFIKPFQVAGAFD